MSATEHAQRSSGSSKPTRWDCFRDGLTFLGAWGIIGWQMLAVPPRNVNETFLLLAAALLGYPFGAEAVARIRGTTGGGGTTESVSPSSSSPSP